MAGMALTDMGFAGLLVVVLVAALLAALLTGLMLRATLRRGGGADGSLAVELERRLAVAEAESSRLARVEVALEAERRARAAAEAEGATVRQEIEGTRPVVADLRGRLAQAEAALAEGRAATTRLHEARAEAERVAAGQGERLVAADARFGELLERHRALLAEGEAAAALHGTLRTQKAQTDELLVAAEAARRGLGERAEDLGRRLGEAQARLDEATVQVRALDAERARLRETLEQERRQAAERMETLLQARQEMTDRFRDLANEIMTRHGEAFTRLNREQIDGVLGPLREKLGEFEQKVQHSHVESARERAALGEQIRGLGQLGSGMQRSTEELAAALRGRSQTQGAWGELVLARVLEQSGLRAGHEYEVQQSFTSEEGARLRPDVIVRLPGEQRMVVDAKVSLTAFEALVNAATEEEREDGRRRHLDSVRRHITTLGSKQYHDLVGGTLNYVMMFVPIEGALAAAVEADRELIPFASRTNVVIATPTTLMVALRTVATVWQVERRNLNAEEIARRAGLLYDKFRGFLDDMGRIDATLTAARQAYDRAYSRLGTGNGNLVRQAEILRELGARTSRPIAAALLEAAEDVSEEPVAVPVPVEDAGAPAAA